MNQPPKPAKTSELAAAEEAALQLLTRRDFEGAARAVAAYEARQPVPRGIGVDWSKPDVGGDLVALQSILDGAVNPALPVRLAAAMMYLWGVSKPHRRWLRKEANGDAAATKLLLRAFEARQAAATAEARRRGFIP